MRATAAPATPCGRGTGERTSELSVTTMTVSTRSNAVPIARSANNTACAANGNTGNGAGEGDTSTPWISLPGTTGVNSSGSTSNSRDSTSAARNGTGPAAATRGAPPCPAP